MDFFSVIEGNLDKKEDTGVLEYQQGMIDTLDNIEERCWTKGLGYISPHFPQVSEATAGFDDGLYFIAGAPNTGKTAVCMNIAYDLTSYEPNNMFGIFFSLDDTLYEAVPRMVAMTQRITIDSVKRPQKYKEHIDIMTKRKKGFDVLKSATKNMALFDANEVSTIEQIEEKIKEYKIKLAEAERPNAKFVIIIDSFDDLDSRDQKFSGSNEKSDYMAIWVKDLHKTYDCIVLCTKHLRKLNGFRRPTTDDLKDSGKVSYEANLTILCHNDVGLKGEKADIYYNREGIPDKQPVIEMHFAKNKLSSYKGRVFAEFIPDYSNVSECSEAACKQFNTLVFQA